MQSPDLAAFRNDIRAFLSEALSPDLEQAAELGFGISREDGARWHRKLYEAGWIAPTWPEEAGGTGWTLAQQHIFSEELALAGAPMIMPFGIGMVGPVIYTFGSEAQKAQHLPGILDGSTWWCQGYSEPGSGSDLASLKTQAVRDGNDYIINGQKIWTTNAHKSDWIFLLVRTDNEVKPQQGITFLLVDMATPGIDVRPIVSIDGLHHLNETYFTDVRVPVSNRIGEENQGWSYAKFLLGHERTGIAGVAGSRRAIEALKHIARQEADGHGRPLCEDRQFMGLLDQTAIKLEALAQTETRLLAAPESGGSAGDKASMLKILGTEVQQALEELRVTAVQYYALPFDLEQIRNESNEPPPSPDYAIRAVSDFNFGRAHTIYGGSNEIQRNVIAKAVLGL